MVEYSKEKCEQLYGNINRLEDEMSISCIGQCTGCMCSCRCSCSGGIIGEVDWEECK